MKGVMVLGLIICMIGGCTTLHPIANAPSDLSQRFGDGGVLQPGDRVIITTLAGAKHRFRVRSVRDGVIYGDRDSVAFSDIASIDRRDFSSPKTAIDNGCKGYRELYRLHVDYQGTQLEFATRYLRSHPEVRLVTLTLGANDGLLLEISCAEIPNPTPDRVEACIEAGAPAVFARVAENIGTILANLRATGYGGAIILTNYYSTDYSDSTQPGITELTAALNAAIAAPAPAYGAIVADVFTVFRTLASDPTFGGQTCKTGLLNPDVYTPNLCNIHPARTGHRLIARTIAHALQAAGLH
jgi:lysophospholipase L1-like esterase